MDEIIRDFDWELDRFVKYRSPLTRKETLLSLGLSLVFFLSLGSKIVHWNINNSLVIDN